MKTPAMTTPRSSSKSLQTAFTLVELLVVIAIIAILVALIFAGLQVAEKATNDAKTISNLRSLGSLMHLYASEREDYFPWGYERSATGGTPATGSWKYRLLEYAGLLSDKGKSILETPSAPLLPKYVESGNFLATGFTANPAVLGAQPNPMTPGDSGIPQIKRLMFPNPAHQIMLAAGGQGNWDNSAPTTTWHPWVGAASPNPPGSVIPLSKQKTLYGGLGYWVKGKAATLMVDGHVETLDPSEVRWINLQRGL